MPPKGRGSKGGHKGQRRHFTNPDDLEAEKQKVEREKKWREQKGELSSSDEDEDKEKNSASEEEESTSEDEEGKAKGVQHLIDVDNPNRVLKKNKKVAEIDIKTTPTEPQQLSRREREELEKQRAKAHYMKLHAAGKTQEAQADLARLAIIRKQREDAAKKRDDDKKVKEAVRQAKTADVNKALGKKT